IVGRLLDFVLVENVAVQDGAPAGAGGPHQVVDAFDALQIHGQALEAVGDLAGSRGAVKPAHLLEVGELGYFHAIEPDFPAQAPGTQGGVFPVVLDEADIVLRGVDAQGAQGVDVQIENFGGRGLEHDLVLVVVLQAVGVFAVAAVFGAPGRLYIGRAPVLGSDGSQERGGVIGAG